MIWPHATYGHTLHNTWLLAHNVTTPTVMMFMFSVEKVQLSWPYISYEMTTNVRSSNRSTMAVGYK